MWSRRCIITRSNGVQPRFVVGLVLLDLQYSVWYYIDHCMSFFFFSHSVICPSSISSLWVPLLYLHGCLWKMNNHSSVLCSCVYIHSCPWKMNNHSSVLCSCVYLHSCLWKMNNHSSVLCSCVYLHSCLWKMNNHSSVLCPCVYLHSCLWKMNNHSSVMCSCEFSHIMNCILTYSTVYLSWRSIIIDRVIVLCRTNSPRNLYKLLTSNLSEIKADLLWH